MLSRASQLTRLNAAYIVRQLSASPTTLSKQTPLSQKEKPTTNEQEATANSPSSLTSNAKSGGQAERTSKQIQNNQYNNNNNNNRTRPSGRGENANQNNLSKRFSEGSCFFVKLTNRF